MKKVELNSWNEEDVLDEELKKMHRQHQVKKFLTKLIMVVAALVLLMLMVSTTTNGAAAQAEGKTVKIPVNSWVFIELPNRLTDEGEAEILLLDLPKGGFYSQFDASRILMIVDADDEETELPAFHHYLEQSKRTNLDELMKKIDAGKKLGAWNSIKSYAKEAGAFIWDKSEDLSTWMESKWHEWGVIDAVEESGWGNRIRDFFGTNN